MKTLNPAYVRKTLVAAQLADAAYIKGGLAGMQDELASLRRTDADGVVIAEFERLYHVQSTR
jgi:HAMP domain-containing protein